MGLICPKDSRAWGIWAVAGVACAVQMSGCANPSEVVGFDEPDPGAQIRAIQQAAVHGDRSSIGSLIRLLASDDPAERLLSIRTLERITGETMGYDHAGTLASRREAIDRWAAWYQDEKRGGGGDKGRGAENR